MIDYYVMFGILIVCVVWMIIIEVRYRYHKIQLEKKLICKSQLPETNCPTPMPEVKTEETVNFFKCPDCGTILDGDFFIDHGWVDCMGCGKVRYYKPFIRSE